MIAIREFGTRAALMQATAARIAEILNEAIDARGVACAALSGGGTPGPAYRALAALALDWPKVTFELVDERFVPPDHDASNERLLRETLAPALAAGARLAPMVARGSLEAAAAAANAAYENTHIDIALMGMGGDCHTASWFPQSAELSDALDLANPRTVISVRAPNAAGSPERLTLTRAAIAKASHRLLLITGDKRDVLLNAETTAPTSALLELPTETFWAP